MKTAMEDTADYVVVGAGSAGCVVAARLSESGRHSVVLLEAGPRDRNPWIHIPMGYAKLFTQPSVNWMYQSEPETRLGGRRLYQPCGKVLGGTSAINGMLYLRGHSADYDGWRDRGCVGWDWDSVLPYFLKSEDQQRGQSRFHNVGGPLHISDSAIRLELAEHWIAGGVQAGLPANDDFNGGQVDGVGRVQSTTWRRRRWSTASAYLRPARGRQNLAVRTGAQATRVLIEEGRAVGVEYLQEGTRKAVRARGEVIVCGGTYNSPQLLQLSGVGPGGLLQDLGISVLRAAPAVGANLQDHFSVRMQFRCTRPITMNDVANNPLRKVSAGLQYALLRRGPLASNGIAATTYARSDPGKTRPDIQATLTIWSFAERDRGGERPHPFPGFSVNAVHLYPDARGSVLLKSADSRMPPAIRFDFLATDYDLYAVMAAMRLIRKIAAQPAMAPFVAGEISPGADQQTDAELEGVVRRLGISNMHPVGTCAMGATDEAVVDPRLRVRGIGHLRVVDASIMPIIPGANTNAASIMIGEKGAAMILEDVQAPVSKPRVPAIAQVGG